MAILNALNVYEYAKNCNVGSIVSNEHSCVCTISTLANSLDNAKSKDVSTQVLQYKLKFKLNYKQKDYYEDDRIVQIGKQFVKDYSGIIFYFDSLKTVNDNKGLPSPSIPHPVFNYEMFNDFKLGVSNLKYRMDLNGGAILLYGSVAKIELGFCF